MPQPSIVDRLQAALADRYRIERELGAGGMATVYLAHDLKHDRQVALKALKPELAAVIGAERFLNEIKVTANLQHPDGQRFVMVERAAVSEVIVVKNFHLEVKRANGR